MNVAGSVITTVIKVFDRFGGCADAQKGWDGVVFLLSSLTASQPQCDTLIKAPVSDSTQPDSKNKGGSTQ